jgi:hypothetical protein
MAFNLACNRHPERWEPRMQVLSAPQDMVWTIVTTPPGAEEDSVYFYKYPDATKIFSGPAKDIPAYWGYGYIEKTDAGIEWKDFDPSSGIFNANPGLKLTSWDTPVSVDPSRKTLYCFGYSVAPTRKLEADFLDGREKELVNQLVAEEFELLTPLPTNSWTVFYVDRPKEARNVTPEETPTRKMRIYAGRSLGGEHSGVSEIFLLHDSVVVNKDNEWILFERGGATGVKNGPMSLSQIPGELSPLARFGDTILVASDQPSGDEKKPAGSVLYTYGVYTRSVQQVWTGSDQNPAQRILAITPVSETEFLVVVGSLPELKALTLGRLKDGNWEPLVKATFRSPATRTEIYFPPQPAPPEPETVQPSTPETEMKFYPEDFMGMPGMGPMGR